MRKLEKIAVSLLMEKENLEVNKKSLKLFSFLLIEKDILQVNEKTWKDCSFFTYGERKSRGQ